MNRITTRIIWIVLLANIVYICSVFFLVGNISQITNRYDELVNGYVENRNNMSRVSANIYHMQSLVWEHIMNTDETKYDAYEENIKKLQTTTNNQVRKLSKALMSDKNTKNADDMYKVLKSYHEFRSHIHVVLELSRSHTQKSAQYYVNASMSDYLNTITDTLETMETNLDNELAVARTQMNHRIDRMNLVKHICLVVVCFSTVMCIIFVFLNARRIVARQTDVQKSHQQRIMDIQYKIIVGMANLIESRDGETGEHVKRTGEYVDMIAKELEKDSIYKGEINKEFLENLWKAAPLHDIGKIKVPDNILQKPGKLTVDEFAMIKEHAAEGGNIIEDTMGAIEEKAYLEMAHNVAMYHHEKWDGSGYPEGLKGEEIPLCARIMAVADVFDALISKRCYKNAMSIDEAYETIEESSGTHFDPEIVKVFVKIRPQIEQYLKNQQID